MIEPLVLTGPTGLTATLYLGDCLDVLPTLAAGSVDAVVTDPPYGISHPTNYHARGRSCLAQCRDYPPIVGDNIPFDPLPILALAVPTVLWGAEHYCSRLPDSPRLAGMGQREARHARPSYLRTGLDKLR